MLKLTIPATEQYDEINEEFITSKEYVLQLEHSLVSLSKWESKWCKPFLGKDPKTFEESVDYIKCMTLTQNVNPDVYNFITDNNIAEVSQYIDKPMTATIFPAQDRSRKNRETITAEILYYWMISLTIPFECQKWHLNRLLTLINVCSIKNQPPKKTSKREIISRNKALNESRRNAMNSKG